MANWKKIKAEYIAGGTSYRKLAEKYGVSFSTLRKVAAKEQWTDLRNKAGAKRDTKIIDSVSQKEAKKATDITDVADKLLGKILEITEGGVLDPDSIKKLTSAIKDIKDIKGVKSEADMREQTARIKKLQREAGIGDEVESGGVIVLPDANAPLIDEEDGCE